MFFNFRNGVDPLRKVRKGEQKSLYCSASWENLIIYQYFNQNMLSLLYCTVYSTNCFFFTYIIAVWEALDIVSKKWSRYLLISLIVYNFIIKSHNYPV